MPRAIKPMRLGLTHRTVPLGRRGLFFVGATLFFDLLEPEAVLTEQAMHLALADQLPPGAIFDEAAAKPSGEFLFAGSAIPPDGRPVRAMQAGVRVGRRVKKLLVFGDRQWVAGPHGPVMSEAAPFDTMPLVAERAFGGPLLEANPVGVGFGARDLLETGHPALLPNIELAHEPIVQIDDCPGPALVGPLGPNAPKRARHLGTYDQFYLDHRFPGLPDDFDPRYYLTAPEDQRENGFFRGDEEIVVVGMSSKHGRVRSRLPDLVARAFMVRHGEGDTLAEIPLRLETVWVLGSIVKAIAIFRGRVKVNDPEAADVATVMIAYERRSDPPRPVDYYQHVYRLRRDPDEKLKYLMADEQLSPVVPESVLAERRARKLARWEEVQRRHADAQRFLLKKEFAAAGLPASLVPEIEPLKIPPVSIPTDEEIERGEADIAQTIEDLYEFRDFNYALAVQADRKIDEMHASLGIERPPEIPRPADLGIPPDASHPMADGLIPQLDTVDLSGIVDAAKSAMERLKTRFPEAMADVEVDDMEGLIRGHAIIERAGAVDVEEDFKRARGRALRLPEGSIVALPREQLQAMAGQLGDMSMPADLDPAAVFANREAGSATDFAGLLDRLTDGAGTEAAAAGPAAAEPIATMPAPQAMIDGANATIAKLFPDLPTPPGGSPLEAMLGEMAGVSAGHVETARAMGNPVEAGFALLDDLEEKLTPIHEKARRTSPFAMVPPKPLPAEAATRLAALAREEIGLAHLAGRDLAGVDFTGADLSGIDFSGCFLERARFAGARLEGANFAGAVLAEADLTGARAKGADFRGANLSQLVAEGADFSGAAFEDGRVMRARLAGSVFHGASFKDMMFLDCDAAGASFDGARFHTVFFTEAVLREAVFSRIDAEVCFLVRCDFGDRGVFREARIDRGCVLDCKAGQFDFAAAHLHKVALGAGTPLTDSFWRNAKLNRCSFISADVSRSSFFRSVLKRCTLIESDFSHADFRLASLRRSSCIRSTFDNADMFAADLFAASFHKAKLRGVNMRSANLFHSNYMHADLTGTDLSEAHTYGTHFRTNDVHA